jgi:hypothetical protein
MSNETAALKDFEPGVFIRFNDVMPPAMASASKP